MPESIVSFFNTYGYVVVFFGAMLDNLGIPSAGDIGLLVGGALAAQGQFYLPAIIGLAALGAAIGDNGAYLVGRYGGHALVRSERRLIRIPHHWLDRGESFFDKHGSKSVFLGRFIPGMRSITPFFAGLNRMRWPIFFISNIIAVILWAIGIGTLAYLFGSNWDLLMTVFRRIRIVLIILAIAAIAGALYLYITRRRRRRAS